MSRSSNKLSGYGSILLLILAAVSLFLAQSAYWINHTVFEQATFTKITTDALLSESSRDSIATTIVDRALENRPVLQRTVGERATSLVSGLLGTDLANQAVKTLSSKVYAYTTASNRKDIKIDLTAIKQPLSRIITLTQNEDGKAAELQAQIPDEIMLVRSSSFPDLSGTVRLMIILGPLLWLTSLVCFSVYIYRGRVVYARRVYYAGLTVVAVAILGLLIGPFVPPSVAAAVPTIELRPVVENLATGFLAPFKEQMTYMLITALVALLVFNQRFNIVGALESLTNRLGGRLSKNSHSKKS